MSHTCSSVLIRCIDFRLTKAIESWMEQKGIMDDCDVISVAGVCKAIAEDRESEGSKFLLDQIELSSRLHHIKTLYIIHHTDCGAYGGHSAFSNFDDEQKRHLNDMSIAKAIIEKRIPGVEIKFILADISDDGIVHVNELSESVAL